MPSRSRSRDRAAISAGKIDFVQVSNGSVLASVSGYAGSTWHETNDDTTMAPPYVVPHPLIIVGKRAAPPLKLNGSMPSAFGPNYQNVFVDYNPPNRSGWTYAPNITAVNMLYWQTKALANLNPSKPIVDLPLFLFEFKDFPSMLKNLGDVLSKRISPRKYPEGYLAYSFGWAPLVSDLRKLYAIAKSIDDRVRYLRNLEHGTHIRRRLGSGVVLHSITSNGYSVSAISSTSLAMQADTHQLETQEAWFTANAKLLTPLPDASELEYFAKRLVLGLNGSPSTLWNMIPWSWLIDYFSNIGDVLEADRGYLKLSIPSMCIMVTSKSTSSLKNVRTHSGISWNGGGLLESIAKQRSVVYAPIPWLTYDPFLSGSQIANLGALGTAAVLKSKGLRIAR